MISHLDEMFEDDKNHDEFFDQFGFDMQEDTPGQVTPSTISEEMREGEIEWYEQLEDIDINLMDDNALEMRLITESISRKIIHETAIKLRKLKHEFSSKISSKIKTKALEQANEKRETFLRKKREIHDKYKLKMNQISVFRSTTPYF